MKNNINNKTNVLVITGGYLTEKENSFINSAKKLFLQSKASKHAWLDVKIKLNVAELLIKSALQRCVATFTGKRNASLIRQYTSAVDEHTPDLTEVILSTLLEKEKITFTTTTYHDLLANRKQSNEILSSVECIFASTTLLHDMSELTPLLEFINREHNKIIVGGALVSSLGQSWPGSPHVDVVAIGYGEYLIPALANWIRSDYQLLAPPDKGRVTTVNDTLFIYAGLPKDTSLDQLERPDWNLTFSRHGRSYSSIYYESVRGCPFRCSFCNYPYLFDDTKFRYKSAEKIAEDWLWYKQTLNVSTIVCLDSLFTVPKSRLKKLCDLLIQRETNINWVCYARADDLMDESLVCLMKQAGLTQVQIGVESADQTILDNMNKRSNTEDAGIAIENCRKYSITTVISLIVGYPGETSDTLETTYQFLCKYPPDFYYLATFSTRIENVPILLPENKQKFELESFSSYQTGAPYWKHKTMSCSEAVNHVRRFNTKMMENKISLNGMVFFSGLYHYKPDDKQALLDYQYSLAVNHKSISWLATKLHRYIDKHLEKEFNRFISIENV